MEDSLSDNGIFFSWKTLPVDVFYAERRTRVYKLGCKSL
jgi:hypothetical protein